ncbi:MAG: ABC transporter permease subunit [Nocardioides sp.]
MIRAIGVELTRLLWRRAVVVLLAASVIVPVVIMATTAYNTRGLSEADIAQAQEQVERDSRFSEREVERCVKRPGRYNVTEDTVDVRAVCEEYVLPRIEYYLYREPLDLDQERENGSGIAVVTLLVALMALLGATFVGHDWATGSMSNQLLFQTRRVRVWVAKAIAVALVAGAITLMVTVAYWLGLRGIAAMRDLDVRSGALTDCLQQGLRGTAFAMGAAVGGYALTMLFRSTVATLGVLFAVSVAGGVVIGVIGADKVGQWEPTVNAAAIVQDGAEYYVSVPAECYASRRPPSDLDCDENRTVSTAHGAWYAGGLLVLAGVPSLLLFRRRDVP